MVKAVLGAVNPAEIATKRFSAAGIWFTELLPWSLVWLNFSVVGAWDPANIFVM